MFSTGAPPSPDPSPPRAPRRFPLMWTGVVPAGVAAALFAALVFCKARVFPPVNTDEAVRAVMGLRVVRGETSRYPLYDDIFARPVYALRDVLPEVSIRAYHAWLGAWVRWNPSDVRLARLSSLAAGLLALFFLHGVGARWGGARAGAWSVALAGFNPLFLTASCLARPETLLVAWAAGALWLSLALPDRLDSKPVLVGAVGMAAMSIHPNAAAISLGLLAFSVARAPRRARVRLAALFALGMLAGLFAALALCDARRLWLGLHTVHSYLLRPPLLTRPWKPWNWLRDTLRVMGDGRTFYFDTALVPGWRAAVRAGWAALALPLVLVWGRREPEAPRAFPWWAGLLAAFAGSVLLVKAKDCLYGADFLPFLVPPAAAALAQAGTARARFGRAVAVALAALSLAHFLAFSRHYAARAKPYPAIANELRALVPPGSRKLAGPSVLWFAWPKKDFRDLGAIQVSHWYMNGAWDVTEWLSGWRPDILVLDAPLRDALGDRGAPPSTALPWLHRPADFLGEIDTGAAYGRWRVYRVHWDGNAG